MRHRREKVAFVCLPARPWRPEYGSPVQHLDTEEIEIDDDGVIVVRCKVCGAEWMEER